MPISTVLSKRLVALLVLSFALFAASLSAEARPTDATSSLILRPVSEGAQGSSWPALTVASNIEAEVTGPLVQVTVTQTFHNPSTGWAEGLYQFPLPDTGAVKSLEMRIGDRVITGIVQEKQEARRTFRAAAEAGQRASLLSEVRPNMFTTSVANIGPGERIHVRFQYLALADLKGSRFTWIMPQAITPRYEGPQRVPGTPDPVPAGTALTPEDLYAIPGTQSSVQPAQISIEFNGADMIAAVTSPTHSLRSESSAGGRLEYSLTDPASDSDLHLSWDLKQGSEPAAHIFTERVDGEDYALLVMIPPTGRPDPETLQPREITFIVDVSGSMGGTPLEAAKAGMTSALSALRPEDSFNIVTFAGSYGRMFPVAMPASRANIQTALTGIRALTAGGGTEVGGPLFDTLTAPTLPGVLKQVVFVTDGAIRYETRIFDLLERERGLARIFTIGTGAAPNHWFLRKTAEYGRGTYLALPYGDIQPKPLLDLIRDMEAPQLTNVALDWSLTHRSPALAPDLYGDRAAYITAKRNPNPLGPLITGDRPDGSQWAAPNVRETQLSGSGLNALWARRELERLALLRHDGVSPADIRAQALPIALKHQIVSPYTSFVAVEEVRARPESEPLAENRLRGPLPAGTQAARFFAPQTGTLWQETLWLALLILGLSAWALIARGRA